LVVTESRHNALIAIKAPVTIVVFIKRIKIPWAGPKKLPPRNIVLIIKADSTIDAFSK
jgi:hypothetical protein